MVKTPLYTDGTPTLTVLCNLTERGLLTFFCFGTLDSGCLSFEGYLLSVSEEESLSSNEDDQEKRLLLDLDPSLSDAQDSSSENLLNCFLCFLHVICAYFDG